MGDPLKPEAHVGSVQDAAATVSVQLVSAGAVQVLAVLVVVDLYYSGGSLLIIMTFFISF